jgi:hypothetical protein
MNFEYEKFIIIEILKNKNCITIHVLEDKKSYQNTTIPKYSFQKKKNTKILRIY